MERSITEFSLGTCCWYRPRPGKSRCKAQCSIVRLNRIQWWTMKTTESKWSAIRWPRGKRCLSMRCWEASSGNIGGDIWWLVFVNTGRPLWVVLLIISSYRLVFKRGNGKSPINGDLNGNIYIYIYINLWMGDFSTAMFNHRMVSNNNMFVSAWAEQSWKSVRPRPQVAQFDFFSDDMFPRSPCPTNWLVACSNGGKQPRHFAYEDQHPGVLRRWFPRSLKWPRGVPCHSGESSHDSWPGRRAWGVLGTLRSAAFELFKVVSAMSSL